MDPQECDLVTCVPISTGGPPDLGWYAMWWASRLGLASGDEIVSLPDLTGNGHTMISAHSVIPGILPTLYDTQTVPAGAAQVGGSPVKFPPFLTTDPTFVLWPPLPQPFTVFAIMNFVNVPGIVNPLIFDPSISAGGPFGLDQDAAGAWTLNAGNGAIQATGGVVPAVRGTHLVEVVLDATGTGWSLTVDGVLTIPLTATGAVGPQVEMGFAGANNLDAFFVWSGVLASVATAADEAAVLAWAQAAYGV